MQIQVGAHALRQRRKNWLCVMRRCTKQTRPPAQRVGNDNNNKSSRPFQREIAVRGFLLPARERPESSGNKLLGWLRKAVGRELSSAEERLLALIAQLNADGATLNLFVVALVSLCCQ